MTSHEIAVVIHFCAIKYWGEWGEVSTGEVSGVLESN